MGRLIDADKLDEIRDIINYANYPMNYIDKAPTVDAIPREKIDEMIAEIEDKICSFNYFASEVTTRDAILKIIHKYCDKEQNND